MIALALALALAASDPGPPVAWDATPREADALIALADDGPPVAWSAEIPRPAPRKAVVRKAVLRRPVADRRVEAPPVVPGYYSLRDSAGQVWTHADPAYLSRWVADRDAFLAADRAEANAPQVIHWWAPVVHVPRARPHAYGYGAACASGGCAP